MSLRRRFGKWLGITAVFALMPVIFDMFVLKVEHKPVSMEALFGSPSTYLIGFSICVAALGDALFDRQYSGGIDGASMTAILSSILVLICGACFYAASKASPPTAWQDGAYYALCAATLSLFTVWTTGR